MALQNFVTDKPGFEIEGDYIGNLSNGWDYKIIGLYSKCNAKTIQETRSESFINYAWQLNTKLRLDSELKYEYSRISQLSIARDRSAF